MIQSTYHLTNISLQMSKNHLFFAAFLPTSSKVGFGQKGRTTG